MDPRRSKVLQDFRITLKSVGGTFDLGEKVLLPRKWVEEGKFSSGYKLMKSRLGKGRPASMDPSRKPKEIARQKLERLEYLA